MTKNARGTEEQQTDYLAYLLRLWRMRGEGAAGWRASLARQPAAASGMALPTWTISFCFCDDRRARELRERMTKTDRNDKEGEMYHMGLFPLLIGLTVVGPFFTEASQPRRCA